MLGERTYSAQETAHLLLGIPLVRCSMSFQSLNISSDGDMREIDANEVEFNEAGERVVTGESWLQRYMKRPAHMENMTLHEVRQQYAWRGGEWRKRRTTTRVIVRTFPRLSPNPEDPRYEEYSRTKILLHHPFRDMDALRTRHGEQLTWREVFAECCVLHTHQQDTLRDWED